MAANGTRARLRPVSGVLFPQLRDIVPETPNPAGAPSRTAAQQQHRAGDNEDQIVIFLLITVFALALLGRPVVIVPPLALIIVPLALLLGRFLLVTVAVGGFFLLFRLFRGGLLRLLLVALD